MCQVVVFLSPMEGSWSTRASVRVRAWGKVKTHSYPHSVLKDWCRKEQVFAQSPHTNSKIGTMHATFTQNPERYMSSIKESNSLGSNDMAKSERFLVGVWACAKVSSNINTFNELRADQHKRKTKPLELMPPTSRLITGHIRRAFYVVRRLKRCVLDKRLLSLRVHKVSKSLKAYNY